MLEDENKISLTDLIDIKLLQKFQDTFAKTMNVACLIYDDKEPITKPSNFNDFCIKYTKTDVLGLKKCNEDDIKWEKSHQKKINQ